MAEGQTQHNPILNWTDTLEEFGTYKTAGKNINIPKFQNMSSKTHRLPEILPPN